MKRAHRGDAQRVRRTKVHRWLAREVAGALSLASGYDSNKPEKVAQHVAVAKKLAEMADVFARGAEGS